MKYIFLILSLWISFSSVAKNNIDNCIWAGIKWRIGDIKLQKGQLETNFLEKGLVPIDFDLTFVSDYRESISRDYTIGNQWKYPILRFLSRPREQTDLKIWEAHNLETKGQIEYEIKFENEHSNRLLGGWAKDTIFLNDYKIDTFSYRHSPKFDTLFIVLKRADISFLSSKLLLVDNRLTTICKEKTATPEGRNSLRGAWNFGNSFIIFDEMSSKPCSMADINLTEALPVDSTQKGMMRKYKKLNNPLSAQSFCDLSIAYWIKDNKLFFSDVKSNVVEIPFKLSADGKELYIVLTRSKLSKEQKELIKKGKHY